MINGEMWNKSHFEIKFSKTYIYEEISEHYHNLHEIILVTQGHSDFEISNSSYSAAPNSFICINNFEKHKSMPAELPYERYYILMSQDFLNYYIKDPVLLSILKNRPEKFNHLINIENEKLEVSSIINKIYRLYIEKDEYMYSAVGNYLNLLLIILYKNYREYFPVRTKTRTFELIHRIQKHIEENFLEDLSLKTTAETFHIDMYYLSHLFREVTGYTFKSYLIMQRLLRAKEMLINTDRSITEVCINSGFNNVNHFIRIFKTKEGMTPLKYRKNLMTIGK